MTVQVKMLRGLLIPLIRLCLSSLVWAQSAASLLVTTDTNCDWKIDGVSQGRLNVDDAKVVKTTSGEHLLQATSADGQLKWQGMVTADSSAQKLVKIPLSDMAPTWTDPTTALMWPRKDNGGDVTWQQAANYCQNLSLGGYTGWRLPTIDESAGIYDQTQSIRGLPIKGGIQITGLTWSGWIWSGSTGQVSGETRHSGFLIEKEHADLLGPDFRARTLCVRRPGAW
jgi:Protein of unknown function (DUF1566)